MENVFLHLLNMSLTAAVLVVVVLLLRLVFHKAPRWIHCLLWALVAVRLLCPFTIESDLSLMPSTPVVTVPNNVTLSDPVIPSAPSVDVIVPDTPTTSVPPQTNVGGTVTTPVTPTLPDSSVAAPGDSVDPWQVALFVATQVWLLGALALLIYAVVSTIRLRLQVRESVCMQDNIWQCDHLRSPFILGVLRPRIYLPSDLDAAAQASVIAHEKAHLKRLDHLWKPLGFLLLAVYWFNPVLWVAYIFLCRDIEAACDEQVVRNMTAADRKAYSEALLACSAPRRLVSACPLAFGETSVKSRIKSVLSYKKPTIWIIVAALLVSTVAGVCLLTDRPVAEQEPDDTPSVSDEDDTPDTAKTAPVGLTHVAGGLGEWQNETLQAVYGTPPEGSLPIKAFTSYDELDAFLTAYATEEGKIQRADFAAFDAAWFADNTLLMSYYTHPTTPAYPKVDSYAYSEDGAGLTVRLHVYEPSFGGDAFSAYHLFSGIRKSDLEGVKNLTAVVAATIPNDYYVAAFAEHTEHPDKAAEKWRRCLPSDEAWALERMLSEWDDAARWGDAQSVNLTFTTAFNLHGHTHYFAPHYSALLRDDGALLWLNEAEGAFLRWIAAYYDETNEDLLYMAYSHPTYYDRRYAAPPMVLNSPELKAILNGNRWEEASGDVSSYGRFTLGGTVYHIDRTRERIVCANENNTALYAVYLTAEELALVDGILASTPWAHTDYMVGKVTQILADEDCVTMKLTDSSKYTSDISDGDEVRVSLRYYAGETPAVGSTVRVTYDGYLGTFYDGEHYGALIHAHSVAVTSQPTGTTTTKPTPTTKPTTTTKPTISPTAQVTFVKFSRPADGPSSYHSYAQYMYPVQPDAATCAWLRQLASKTNWVARDTFSGDYDAYFTIGDDENYYYIDRVNQRLFHNRRFASLTKEETSKLDTLIRSYGIQPNAPMTGKPADWSYLIGRVQEFVDGENGYVLLKVDYQGANLYGDVVKVSTRFIPRQLFAIGKTVCVVYDHEPDVETTPFTIYAAAMNELKENDIISTGVPLYDDLLRQIQTYYYNRSVTKPDCSSMVWSGDSLLETGVRLVDLDKDGQDELVLDAAYDMFWMGSYDVYTIRNGKLVHLFSSMPDVRYSLCKNGYVCREWMKNVSDFGEEYYRIEGGTLTYIEGVVFDTRYNSPLGVSETDAWYRVTIVDGEKHYESITLEEAEQITQKYGKDDVMYNIKVIPFSL